MQPIRQGDVILQPLLQVEREKISRWTKIFTLIASVMTLCN
jgi:hypothetical protein